MSSLGLHLKAARSLLDLSQEQLAGLSGVSVATIKRIEAGKQGSSLAVNALTAAMKAEGVVICADVSELGAMTVDVVIAKIRS